MYFTRSVTVLPSQASSNSQLKLRSLLDLFQDTAAMAVTDLEGSSTELMARGYAWVLRCYEIEFIDPFALPMLDETFEIKTWHDPSHGYNMLRSFEVLRPGGELFIWAKTAWLLLDLASGRPVRPADRIPRLAERFVDNISPDFREVPREKAVTDSNAIIIPWTVRFHDLDANGHVNNAAYFEWLFEATLMLADKLGLGLPDSDCDGKGDGRNVFAWSLKSVAATFRTSIRWGDKIKIQVTSDKYQAASEASEASAAGESEASEKNENTRTFVYRIVNESNPSKSGPVFVCTWLNWRMSQEQSAQRYLMREGTKAAGEPAAGAR